MDTKHNPYAPSHATLAGPQEAPHAQLWRSQNVLVMRRDGDLPDRCVKCNDSADDPTKTRKLYWHHPGFYALLIISPLIYIIAALIARKTAKVSPGLCVRHKHRRARGLWLGWGGLIVGLAILFSAASGNQPVLALFALLAMFGSIIAGMIIGRVVYAKRIDANYIHMKGCGEEFLAELPEFAPGTRNS
jgi:hypothetical protein